MPGAKEVEVCDPVESAAFVMERATHVRILPQGIDAAAELILNKMWSGDVADTDWMAQELHPKTRDGQAANWCLMADALNFSFWSEAGVSWVVTRDGTAWTGYFAACAALNNAIDRGLDFRDPHFARTCTLDQVRKAFSDDSGVPIPLLEERHRIIQETGAALAEDFGGSFLNCVEAAGDSAQTLLRLIVQHFPSFRDEAVYEGRKVGFYKRAQILVADVWRALDLPLRDIDTLTVFADYRVPQVLAFVGALSYSPELLAKLEAKEELEAGSAMDVEIRAATVDACRRITKALRAQLAGLPEKERPRTYAELNDVVVDNFLWCFRRAHAAAVEAKVPFHRTRGIYY